MKYFLMLLTGIGLFAPVAAIALESFGFYPCKLCIYSRYGYLFLAVSAILALKCNKHYFVLPALMALFCLGLFHVGLENNWWNFNLGCTSTLDITKLTVENFYAVLSEKEVIGCDVKQRVLFNLSFAELNLILIVMLGGTYAYIYRFKNRANN